jgi:hypothetical protein
MTYRTIGDWTWNDELLWAKIVKTGDDDCWAWTGSVGPFTNLMGAKKNGIAQMTQARRLVYRSLYNEDCEHLQIRQTCKNRFCMNPNHFEVLPNQRIYRIDGSDRTIPLPEVEQPKLARAKLKPVKEKWWNV